MPRREDFDQGEDGLSTEIFPLPGWATCPKRLGPGGRWGQPSKEFSNGHHFSEGADHRDKTTVTMGP